MNHHILSEQWLSGINYLVMRELGRVTRMLFCQTLRCYSRNFHSKSFSVNLMWITGRVMLG